MNDIKSILDLIPERKKYPVNREVLIEVLMAQNVHNSNLAKENISKLSDNENFTVCTGQQLGFAGGPLFVIYKALSVIYLANKLNELNPKNQIIPIFWMASEDHDWEEVNHFYTDFQTKISFPALFQGPVGRFIIPDYQIDELFSEWKDIWKTGVSWSQAFRKWLEMQFGDYGLVILDADDKRLKQLANHLWQRELYENFSNPLIMNENEKILHEGGKIQLHTRDVNLFVIDDKSRFKIEPEGLDLPHDASDKMFELKKLIEGMIPCADILSEHISPNAALRPVYQEIILPNLSYVAGNAEIAYWKQLVGVFKEMQVFLPKLIKRASGKVLLQKDYEHLKSLNFDEHFIFKKLSEIRKEIVEKLNLGLSTEELTESDEIIKTLEVKLQEKFPELVTSAKSIRKTLEIRIKQLDKKIITQALNKNPQIYKPILEMKYRVEPDGFIQERKLSIVSICKSQKEVTNFIQCAYSQMLNTGLDDFLMIF